MAQRKWKKDYGYSDAAMKSLERGTYGKETGRTAKYKTSQEQTQQAKTLPTLKGMTKEPTQVNIQQEMNKEPKTTVSQNSAQKPSTRYQQNVNTEPKKSDRDTTFDKDFDYYWNYRYGDNSGEVDYDRAMDIERPHWETIKEQIKRRNKLSDEEFDSKFEAYNKERTQQAANQEVKQGRDIASKNPILGTLLQALYTPQNMIEGGASMLSNLAPEKYKAQSADDTLFTGTRAKEGIKQTVKDEHIKSNAGKTVYDIGTGLGDMVMAQGIPVLGAAALGTQAAARSNMQALERGVDPNKAAATGAVSGIISGAMNKVGLDKALGSAGKTAVGTVAKAAAKEGAENVLEDAANLGIDKLINQDKSQLNTLHDYYVGQGMTDDDAWSQVAKDTGVDLATSFGSGAAFGGIMSGIRNLPALRQELKGLSLNNKGMADVDNLRGLDPEIQAILRREPTVDPDVPVKDQLKEQDYNSIYGNKAGKKKSYGLVDDINLAKKYAGDTPEAKQLAKETTELLNKYVESGKTEDYFALVEKATALDNLAKETNATYTTKKGKEYTYTDTFGTDYDAMGNEYADSLSNRVTSNSALRSVQDIHNQLKAASTSKENKPSEVLALPQNDVEAEKKGNVNSEGNTRRSFFPPEPPVASEPPRSDKMGTSKVGTNSAVNAEIFTKDQIDNDPVISELNKYAKANNEETFNAAKENVLNNGTALLDEYTSGKRNINNDLDVDQSMLLLKGLTDRINEGDTSVEAQRNLLFSKLRQAGTLYGQTIQAFKKWNDTPEGAVINGERLLDKPTSRWKKSNKQQVELNSRIAKALENMGKDNSMNSQPKEPKTHEQIKEGVKNVIEREFGSVEKYFNDNDLEYLTILAENKDIPVWQITDEIEHKMNTGDWYTLDESIEPKKPTNQKLKNALDALVPRETVEKKPLTFDEIRDQVRNTLDKEMAGVNDFSDDDVNYLANLIDSGATKAELTEALNTKMATGRFGISLDTQQKVNDLFTYANRYDPNSKQAIEAKTAAYKLIADETVQNASPWEKFESWRYLAMLGNPKTMVRNFVGNKMFSAVTGVSNNLSAMLEAGTDKLARKLGSDGIQRTKAVLNPIDDRGLIKAAGEDAEAHRYSQLEGTKYEKGTQDAIRKQKSVFNSKLVRLYEQAVDKGISDYGAVKRKYSTSLAGYMKANGLDESAFDADNTYRGLQDISRKRVLTDDERARMESYKGIHDQLEKARDYAVKQAEYATFHEDNAIAKFLTKHSQDYRNSDNVAARGLGYMLEGVVPFKKTPANILISGVEYSPLGALKSIKETGKLIYENTGKRKGNLDDTYTVKGKLTGREREVNKTLAADVLDSWSKTLTGTGLVALGYYLKNKGILNSSNKDEKWQDDLEGIQNYSITINGKTYTLDWAAPAVMPLLMGAEISKLKDRSALLDQKWYDNMDAIGETANALLDPMFETSMLSGIKDTVEEAAKQMQYNENGAIGGILGSLATNTATGYLTQGLPTVLGQVARTVDNTRRTTDTATSSAMLAPIEKQGRKLMNKIPGLSKLNQPYYDAYGRTQSNSPTNNPIANLAYQMGVPSYIRDINTTDADKQARDVYYGEDENGKPIMDSKVFPAWKSTVKVDGQKLSPEEMATYRKESGEANYAIRDALTKEDWFKDLDADKQAEILKKANTVVDHIGKDAAGFYGKGDDFEAYQKGGVPSLLDRWKGKAADSKANAAMTEAGISTTSNAAKEIKAEMAAGNTEKANQLIEQTKSDTDAAKEAGYVDEEGHVRLADYQKLVRSAGTQSEKMKNDLPKLNELGMDHKALHVYANTVQVIPSVTPNQFVQTYNAINTNTENKITQEEMMNYLNSHNLSDTEAKQIYNAYNDGSWKNKKGVKKTIKKENGKWVDYYPK